MESESQSSNDASLHYLKIMEGYRFYMLTYKRNHNSIGVKLLS